MSRYWLGAALVMMAPWLLASVGCAASKQLVLRPDADEIQIYSAFLNQFHGERKSKVDVARFARIFPGTDYPGNAPCLEGLKMAEIRSPRVVMSLEDLAGAGDGAFTFVDPDKAVAKPEVTQPRVPSDAGDDSFTPEQTIAKRQREQDSQPPPTDDALLNLSRIAFDVSRDHAFLSYSLSCSGLCGESATFLFVKVPGNWVIARTCSRQIS